MVHDFARLFAQANLSTFLNRVNPRMIGIDPMTSRRNTRCCSRQEGPARRELCNGLHLA
jgi:hypothetical protein